MQAAVAYWRNKCKDMSIHDILNTPLPFGICMSRQELVDYGNSIFPGLFYLGWHPSAFAFEAILLSKRDVRSESDVASDDNYFITLLKSLIPEDVIQYSNLHCPLSRLKFRPDVSLYYLLKQFFRIEQKRSYRLRQKATKEITDKVEPGSKFLPMNGFVGSASTRTETSLLICSDNNNGECVSSEQAVFDLTDLPDRLRFGVEMYKVAICSFL